MPVTKEFIVLLEDRPSTLGKTCQALVAAFIAHCQVAKPDKPSTHMISGRRLNQRLEESGDRASRRLICSYLQSEPDVLRLRSIPALSQIVRH